MASRRTQLISTGTVMALAVGGYGLHLATAQSAPPELSQTPMNIASVIPPAFIMGVDNSGSMTSDETLFRTDEGSGFFDETRGSFFAADGTPYESGNNRIEFSKAMDGWGSARNPVANRYADYYGALRAPEYNRAYFNPASTYAPWVNVAADGSVSIDADSPIGAAVEDPRGDGVTAYPFTTFDFTTYQEVTETWLNGKVMPKGTAYYRDKTCNGLPNKGQAGWQTLAADFSFSSNCSTKFRYYPARVYLSLTAAPPPGFDLTKRVLIKGAGPAGADLYRYDYLAANFTTGGAAAVQNFANWWTYYGNRNRAMIAGMTNSLAGISAMRIGYFKITPDSKAAAGESTGTLSSRTDVTMRNMSTAADKSALYTSMRALNSSGTTPTRSATAFMVQQFMRTDAGAPVRLQCQKNAGMLFTDGFTNESTNARYGLTIGDQDGSSSSPYVVGAPYTGGVASSNTIADIAMYGYKTILRTDTGFAAGNVPVPKVCEGPVALIPPGTDCNPNLHMNFYGVTLGARGKVYEVNSAATANPYAVAPYWEAIGTTNLNPSNVDDIWHAALNSRGEFINAQSPTDITAAMRRILAAVNDGATPSGTLGVTGARVGSGSLVLQPGYESKNNGMDWYGELKAETAVTDAATRKITFAQAWEAGARLAAQGHAARNIRFGTAGSGPIPTVREFTAGNLSFSALCSGPLAVSTWCNAAGIQALDHGQMDLTRAVAYLRGSRVDEGVLRSRTSILGDIINSSPVLASPTDDYGYRALGGTLASSYATYLADKKTLNRPLAIVGANDGMLHVFDGRSASPGGNEIYAYIPATALDHMGNLLFPYDAADKNNQKFKHTYFVDGPIAISDVYVGNAWKTIAVGTAGAGGRSVFALDITNPAAITVLWEISNLITGNAGISDNIGHVLGRPVIVPVKDGSGVISWKVVFGNGYNSANQQARLFVVDAASGVATTIAATEATAPAYNGLGSISVIDGKKFDAANAVVNGRDGYSDTVYAADQNGAVWKFDLLSNSVALSGQPLFVAKDPGGANVRRPILGGLTTAAGPSGGVMVYFGTGSFSFSGDTGVNDQQTIYGIFDNGITSVSGRSALLQQTYGADANGFRTTSNNPFVAGKRGWYLDLPTTERFVGNPRVESGVVFFPAYEPRATAAADCSVGGTNWLYGLNALSGGAALGTVRIGSPTGSQATSGTGAIALKTDGSAPVKDVGVLTSPRASPLPPDATQEDIDDALAGQCSMLVRVAGAPALYLPRPCGRQSWRQVR